MDDNNLIHDFSALNVEMARYQAATDRNSKEIAELDKKLEGLEITLSKTSVHLEELTTKIKELSEQQKADDKSINNLSLQLSRIDDSLHIVTSEIKEIRKDIKEHNVFCQTHTNEFDKEVERTHGERSKVITAIDNIKSDVADIEESISSMKSEFETRVSKLEDVRKLKESIKNIILFILGIGTGIATIYGAFDKFF